MKNRLFLIVLSSALVLCGCSRAPSVSILGSFFPAWIICCLIGIALTVISYVILMRVQFHPAVPVPVITYPCLAILYTFAVWLIFYS